MNYEVMSDNQIDRLVSKQLKNNDGLDYCSSWADAGPIIEDYKISIRPYGRYGYNWYAYKGSTVSRSAEVHSRSPLRAAMICFLKMKDSENGIT